MSLNKHTIHLAGISISFDKFRFVILFAMAIKAIPHESVKGILDCGHPRENNSPNTLFNII